MVRVHNRTSWWEPQPLLTYSTNFLITALKIALERTVQWGLSSSPGMGRGRQNWRDCVWKLIKRNRGGGIRERKRRTVFSAFLPHPFTQIVQCKEKLFRSKAIKWGWGATDSLQELQLSEVQTQNTELLIAILFVLFPESKNTTMS